MTTIEIHKKYKEEKRKQKEIKKREKYILKNKEKTNIKRTIKPPKYKKYTSMCKKYSPI
jgi:hypothetical protein